MTKLRREYADEYDAYKDSETVRNLVDSILVVNRNIQSNIVDEDAPEEDVAFVEAFNRYAASEIQRVAPTFWETIKEDQQ
jgi:hypothetical protein